MKKKAPVMRLKCSCNRNLADVTLPTYGDGLPTNPDWTRDGLSVVPRPNVRQDDWRPWHEANRLAPDVPAPPGALDRLLRQMTARKAGLDVPDEGDGVDFPPASVDPTDQRREWPPRGWHRVHPNLKDADDWKHRTYTWHCRCGLTHTRRHERVSAAWLEWMTTGGSGDTPGPVLVLGQHL